MKYLDKVPLNIKALPSNEEWLDVSIVQGTAKKTFTRTVNCICIGEG
jgi:hypothetical protein